MGTRKSARNLTAAEKTAFVNAVLELKTNGGYDPYVRQHIDRMSADSTSGTPVGHLSPTFLPWHRYYLLRYEQSLQAIDPSVSLPYWDWTTDGSSSPIWGADFLGDSGSASQSYRVTTGPFRNWTLTQRSDSFSFLRRRFGGTGGTTTLPTATQVNQVQGVTPYDASPWDTSVTGSYRNQLEGARGPNLHNRVHNWVSGTMAGAGSPNDPVFWLHHANVDRIWSLWQVNNSPDYLPSAGTANRIDLNEPMEPVLWGSSVTPSSVLTHSQWYTYQ